VALVCCAWADGSGSLAVFGFSWWSGVDALLDGWLVSLMKVQRIESDNPSEGILLGELLK
jgi:hypothetical protein